LSPSRTLAHASWRRPALLDGHAGVPPQFIPKGFPEHLLYKGIDPRIIKPAFEIAKLTGQEIQLPPQNYQWKEEPLPGKGLPKNIPRSKWYPVFTPSPETSPLLREQADRVRNYFETRPWVKPKFDAPPVSRIPNPVAPAPLPEFDAIRIREIPSYVSALFRPGQIAQAFSKWTNEYAVRYLTGKSVAPFFHVCLILSFTGYVARYEKLSEYPFNLLR
jgi:hypothetical protein